MHRIAAACLAAAALALSGKAMGQASPEMSLAFLDYNKDGKLDLNEYLNFQMQKMKTADANQNGRLSLEEFKSTLQGNAAKDYRKSMAAFDKNKNKGLEQEEFLGYHAFIFKNFIDKDKDDIVTLEEWTKLLEGKK